MFWKTSILPQAFFWFGIMMGVFGFLTETATTPVFGSSSFYLTLAGVSFLAGIYKLLEEKR